MFTVLTTKCNSQRTRKTIQLNAANYIRIQIIFITSGETSYCTMQQRQIIGLIISALSSVASLSSAFRWISVMSVIKQQTAVNTRLRYNHSTMMITHTHSLFQFGSHRLDSHNIHTIKSENLDI